MSNENECTLWLYFASFHYLFLRNPLNNQLYKSLLMRLDLTWQDLALAISKSYSVNLHWQILYLCGSPLCFTLLLSHFLHLFSGCLLEWFRQFLQDQAAYVSRDGLTLTSFLKRLWEDRTGYGQQPPSTWTGLTFSNAHLWLHAAKNTDLVAVALLILLRHFSWKRHTSQKWHLNSQEHHSRPGG